MLNQESSKQTQLPLIDHTKGAKSMNLTKLQAEIVKISLARDMNSELKVQAHVPKRRDTAPLLQL